jgi:DegV family protein with EDD domain
MADAGTRLQVQPAKRSLGTVARVAVVTDSSTCLPHELLDKLNITVVPVSVHLPGSDTVDGSDQLSRRISEAVERDQYVRSSQPFITDYLAAIEDSGCAEVAVVTPAMEFAGMYRNASLAAELTSRRAVVLDSRTAAAGQALVVLAGAETAATGAGLDAVVGRLEEAARTVDLVAALQTLEPIRRSRRVPAPALGGESPEAERSLFRMRDGTVQPLGDLPGEQEALARIAEEYRSGGGEAAVHSTVFHADCPDVAERLCRLLGDVDFVSGFSAAMQLHTGAGVVGAAWLPKEAR